MEDSSDKVRGGGEEARTDVEDVVDDGAAQNTRLGERDCRVRRELSCTADPRQRVPDFHEECRIKVGVFFGNDNVEGAGST